MLSNIVERFEGSDCGCTVVNWCSVTGVGGDVVIGGATSIVSSFVGIIECNTIVSEV